MNESSRAEILEHILRNPGITARQISIDLHLTQADIYYHLSSLIQQGAIHPVPAVKLASGGGRPANGFQFTHYSPHDNLANLIVAILKSHPGILAETETSILAGVLTENFNPGSKSSIRILADQVIKFLTPMNYQPRWEASSLGPRIVFENCPYESIRVDNPQLCNLDVEILRLLFGLPASIHQTRSKPVGKPIRCIFQVCQ